MSINWSFAKKDTDVPSVCFFGLVWFWLGCLGFFWEGGQTVLSTFNCRTRLTVVNQSEFKWLSFFYQSGDPKHISPMVFSLRSASWYETYLYCWTRSLKMLACSCQFCWVERHYHHEHDNKTSVVLVKCKWKVETILPLRDHSVKWQNREKLWSRGISILQVRDRCVGLPRFIKQISARIKHECPYSRRHQN